MLNFDKGTYDSRPRDYVLVQSVSLAEGGAVMRKMRRMGRADSQRTPSWLCGVWRKLGPGDFSPAVIPSRRRQ
jgi:hypothetical protein